MEVVEKSLYPLKKGNLFVVLEVKGKRGEEINLIKQGIKGQVIFFHEAPKTNRDCAYCAEESILSLGGAEIETERTIYLVVC